MLLAGAQEEILITTPYFIPDKSSRHELTCAAERGVKVRIITPNEHIDHSLVRGTSRRLFGELLEAGAEIYEYQPSMTHTKTLVIDRLWSVVGSTNFDNRSFGLNDEVNLAAIDQTLAVSLVENFERDIAESKRVTLDEWQRRSLKERGFEQVGRLLERQQ
jgi:cardiolipin synthase